ncbi:MAG: endonuclease III [Methanosarcinales archaeon]|nr:endonuclease III [Methanosarcinales archaeon]
MAEEHIDQCIDQCIGLLEEAYGEPLAGCVDPLDLLVATILSQNTTDVNSLRAFSRLRSAFPDYRDLLRASLEAVVHAIRVGGLAEIKAQRIREALGQIQARAGEMDLGFLREMEKEEARRFLTSLPGVGPKTAAVVMLFGFGFPTMPVDTHVYRLSRRLGLVPGDAGIEEAQRVLEGIVPQEKYLSLHLNLIRHGRRICRARSPLCDQCPLKEICLYRRDLAQSPSGQKD